MDCFAGASLLVLGRAMNVAQCTNLLLQLDTLDNMQL